MGRLPKMPTCLCVSLEKSTGRAFDVLRTVIVYVITYVITYMITYMITIGGIFFVFAVCYLCCDDSAACSSR